MPIPKRPFRILSLDGGGVRGAASAAFLLQLEADLGRPLHEAFDLIAGTSAGGLLALYLARGGSAFEAAQLFDPSRVGRIMDKSEFDRAVPNVLQPGPKYDGSGKRKVLAEVFGGARLRDAKTGVLVTAYDPAARQFVAYSSISRDQEGNPLMKEIADATSAAPGYFPPGEVSQDNLPPKLLVDGGLGANNPAMAALADALALGVAPSDISLLSIGTGRPKANVDEIRSYREHSGHWGMFDWLKHGVIDHLMDASMTASDRWCRQILGGRYVRIDEGLGAASQDMDDTRAQNILALKAAGRDWYDRHGQAALAVAGVGDEMTTAVSAESVVLEPSIGAQ